jgi:hypothetical protein
LSLVATGVDLEGLLAELSADSDLRVELTEREFSGPALTAWGWVLDPTDAATTEEAMLDAAAGAGSIEMIIPPDGVPAYQAFVKASPYREQVMTAFAHTGLPVFAYQSCFVQAKISWAKQDPPLVLSFDRATRATGSLEPAAADPAFICESDEYVIRAGSGVGAAAYMRAVEISDRLARHGTLDRIDTSGYVESRDELELISAMATSGLWAHLMRDSLARRS